MRRKILTLVSLIIVSTMVLTACAPAPAPAPEKVVETVVVEKEVEKIVEKTVLVEEVAPDEMAAVKEFLQGKKVCAVLPGKVNDSGWTTTAYLGLLNLRDKFGMEVHYREFTKVEEADAVIRDYGEFGCDMIFAHGFEYFDQVNALAKEFPEIQFVQTSRCTGQEPNVMGVCYSTGEGGYFIGRMAAQITKTGKVAYVVGTAYPNMDWHPVQSQVAADDLGLDVEVVEVAVGSWEDPAKAKELTKALIDEGYDVFVMIADAGDTGVVEAVREAREAGKTDLRAISWVKDLNYLGPDFVIGGWEEKVWKQVENAAVAWAKNGDVLGKGWPQGLKDGVVGLLPMYNLVPAEVEKDVVETLQKYVEDPASLPNIVVREDL